MRAVYKKRLISTSILWAACFVPLMLVYVFVVSPHVKGKKQIEAKLFEEEQLYNNVLEVSCEETKLKMQQQLELVRNNLKDFVGDSEDLANLTFDISQIANSKNLSSFTIAAKERSGGTPLPNCQNIVESRIEVSFTSNFSEFALFLNALERHRPVIFIDRFVISRSVKNTSEHKVNMSMVVLTRKTENTQS